ncbi:MAG: hypothetical protein DRJ29_09600 [Bacteroidetes bacterium]|nr:MAG: hypothetical protein DRJ29_09600 [Bacteroidota bacterium]
MSKVTESKIEELAREKMEGKSYSTIRDELSESGMTDSEITNLIRQVDERVLSQTIKQASPDRAQQWYRSGLVLAVIGLILTIAFNAGIILKNLPAMVIYSPFIAGILVMAYGRYQQKKQSAPSETGTGAIRRKRPYK